MVSKSGWPVIGVAHASYSLGDALSERGFDRPCFEVRSREELAARIGEVDVLVVSSLWRNEMLGAASRLRFIQTASSGVDNFDLHALAARNIRLANSRGVAARAVAEHALALMLSFTRQTHLARDRQHQRKWRPLITNRSRREDELDGKTMLIIGAGAIGSELAQIARNGFRMHTIGLRRHPESSDAFDVVAPIVDLAQHLPKADVVVLTCPLTEATRGIIGAAELALMRVGAILINVGRGGLVDEAALVDALASGHLSGAGLDCLETEPLPSTSPLWAIEQVVITPHSAGETRAYEARVVDLLIDNLQRLDGTQRLRNELV